MALAIKKESFLDFMQDHVFDPDRTELHFYLLKQVHLLPANGETSNVHYHPRRTRQLKAEVYLAKLARLNTAFRKHYSFMSRHYVAL